MKKVLSVILSIVLMILVITPSVASASENSVEKLSFNQLGEEGKEVYVYVEELNHFSVMSDLEITYSRYDSIGIVEKCNGLEFKSDNESVLKLTDEDYGVFEALTPGEANITISYPGIDSLKLKVNVVEKGSYDIGGKFRVINEKLDALYAENLSTKSVINYYNELLEVTKQLKFIKGDHYLANPNDYLRIFTWDRLRSYLESSHAIYYSKKPFTVKKISNFKKNSISITLSRKLNDNDIVSYCMVNDTKYKKSINMKFRAIFLDGKKGAKDPYNAKFIDDTSLELKTGCSSFTVKIPSKIKKNHIYAVVMSIDDYYGFTWTTGKYFNAK